MKIEISELRKAADLLLNYLESNGIDAVDIEVDYYWHIDKRLKYDAYQEPEEFTIGQISEDIIKLRRMLEIEDNMLPHGFVWLSSLLRAVGEFYLE